MREVLISIIIPVYNGEKFIARAIESVLCQADGSVELVLVNDGSVDNSGMICDAYAQEHKNVRVVHKKNGGLSSARNAGIAAAQGAYLLFLDADDRLAPEACHCVSEVIHAAQPDCVDFGWTYVNAAGEETENHHKVPKDTVLNENYIAEVILPPLLNLKNDPDHFIYDFSCTKSFRRDIILQNGVAFDEGRRVWEDRPFVVEYLKYCKTFYSMDRCLYYYMDIPNSLSRRYSKDFFRIIIANFAHYRGLYGDRYDFDTEYVNSYWSRAIENMIFRSLEQTEDKEEIRKIILETLSHQQVVQWFANRVPENSNEAETSRLIVEGKVKNALDFYRKEQKKRLWKQSYKCMVLKAKRVVHRCVGR